MMRETENILTIDTIHATGFKYDNQISSNSIE